LIVETRCVERDNGKKERRKNGDLTTFKSNCPEVHGKMLGRKRSIGRRLLREYWSRNSPCVALEDWRWQAFFV